MLGIKCIFRADYWGVYHLPTAARGSIAELSTACVMPQECPYIVPLMEKWYK